MRSALVFALACAVSLATHAQQQPAIADLKTTAEASGFKSTSTYDDVVKFMKAVDAASPIVHYITYGTTHEGRAMPMAVVGTGLKNASAAAVRGSGKLRVHIQGNIHAGEVEGKESAQILLREFALGQHKDWLQSMVFLVTPILNADGNEKFALNNRQRQNGPINGMGTRPNAQGLNINRDFMKLDTPEGKAFVKLWVDYDPQVGFDLHTSDGSFHGYHLTYSPPLNPNTSGTIMKMMKDEWFPFVTKNIKAKHGWETFYYGNVSTPGGRGRGRGRGAPDAATPPAPPTPPQPTGPLEWRTFEHVPRFHNSYVGIRNRFALLSEAYAYATFEDRIKATNYFMEEALNFAHTNAARIRKAAADADRETIVGRPLATSARIKRGGMFEILMGEVEDEKNPVSGAVMNRRKDVVKPEQMVDMLWFEPVTTETVPSAYYVPANATKAIEHLEAHGIQMKQATLPGGIEVFAITANTAGQNFEGHAMRRLEGAWGAALDGKPDGKYWEVRMNQPLARLAFHLLEPMSDDGLVTWNFLDEQLKDAKVYPILRRSATFKAPPPRFTDPDRRAKLEKAFPEIDRLFQEYATSNHIPGAAWGVIIDGELAHRGVTGYRDLASKAPVTPDTVFRIASMTKSFTAIAILKLRDEGKLALDDPAEKYVPEMKALVYPTADSPKITIRHLLSHAEGFPEDNPWGDQQLAESDAALSAMIEAGIPFSNAPGIAYEYSNFGFAILGRIVANVSRASARGTRGSETDEYTWYVTEHVLKPLGMTSTTLEPASVPAARLAHGYRWEDGQWKNEPLLANGSFGSMGGMLTTLSDLGAYVGAFLAAWPPRDGAEGPPIRRASLREMQQVWRPASAAVTMVSAPSGGFGAASPRVQLNSGGYGYGLRISQNCQFPSIVSHSGGLPGFGTLMRWLPEYGLGFIAFGNLTYSGWSRTVDAAADTLARTGGLQPRTIEPSPALTAARDAVAGLVVKWDDAVADRIAAENLFLDQSKERRRAAMAALRAQVGACTAGSGFDRVENVLRGDWTMACERGRLRVAITLAPTNPPAVQFLSVNPAPPPDQMRPGTCPR